MRSLDPPRDRIVDFLLQTLQGETIAVEVKRTRQEVDVYVSPASLKQVAEAVEVRPPTALNHLRRLADEGRVAKVQTADGPRYALLPCLKVEWQDPKTLANLNWTSNTPVDWRFPLVSRVPDAAAQGFLLQWLDLLLAKQILPALRSQQQVGTRKPPPQVDFVVYGSCARGDATARSDIDILVVGDLAKKQATQIVDAAHEASLVAKRSPDIRAMNCAEWRKAEPTLRANIRHDGIVVYSSDPRASVIRTGAT